MLNGLTNPKVKNNRLQLEEILTTPVVINDTFSHNLVIQRVVIVMATYNGSRFIEEQIISIQAQSYSDWVLYIRDDGSRDDTVQKTLLVESKDQRIKLVQDKLGNQGPIGNFSTLMNLALQEKADYVFFADQDDVWHQDKLAIMLGGIRNLELTYGNNKPLLVHCDLTVVNDNLVPIANSFVDYSRLSPTSADLGVLLCQNQVTGCACVINSALLKLACPVPENVLMHDWWLALLAATTGKVGFIPKQLVLYRQHSGNVLGATSFKLRLKKLLFSSQQWKLHIDVIKRSFLQAGMLEERIRARGHVLGPLVKKRINTYSKILNIFPICRVVALHQQRIGRVKKSTGLVFLVLITIMRKKFKAKFDA